MKSTVPSSGIATLTVPCTARDAGRSSPHRGERGRSGIRPVSRSRMSGFSLVELIITIVIVGILAAIAIPSYTSFIAGQSIKTASFDIIAALTLARSEALKRNANVTVDRKGGAWINGWEVRDAGGALLSDQGALKAVTITVVGTPPVTYAGNGRLTPAGAAFTFAITSAANPAIRRCVTIDLTGRPVSRVGGCA